MIAGSDWPTPLLVYSEAELERLHSAFPACIRPFFALKSCYRPPVLRKLRELGCGAEVMSQMEWELARAAGWSGPDLIVNGLGRSAAFLAQACADGNWIVVDCADDARRLPPGYPRLGWRLKEERYTRDSKLGMGHDPLNGRGRLIHLHVTSQQRDPQVYVQALQQVPDQAEQVDLGGGLDSELPAGFFAPLEAAFRSRFPAQQLWLEPGRYLVNSAGFLLTTVTAVKDRYVVVDAGTNTMMPHKEATYQLLEPAPGEHVFTVVDGITSLSSVLVRDCGFSQPPRTGQRLVFAQCGAYTSAMSQFWAFEPIPTAFLRTDGTLEWDLTPDVLRDCRRRLLGA